MMLVEPLAALFIAALTAMQDFAAQEPTLPDTWVQTFEVRCGRSRLRITGYGARLPIDPAGPVIQWNGRALQGPSANSLRRDLSNRRAAYRLTGQCDRSRGRIFLHITSGEITYPGERPPGQMRYMAGGATIRRGRIEQYRALEPATDEAFWFR